MELKDIKKYRGYLPIKAEKEETVKWMINLIGDEWKKLLWFNKFGKNYVVRYRFGNKNVTQIYLKDKSWKEVPVDIWLKLTELNPESLDESCWKWINNQKQSLNIKQKKVSSKKENTLLDI